MATFNILNPYGDAEEYINLPPQETPHIPPTAVDAKSGRTLDPDATLKFDALEFQSFGHVMRVRSDNLARQIKAAYQEFFHDLRGVNIKYAPPSFIVEFYFEFNTEPMPDGKFHNLIDLAAPVKGGEDLFDKYQVLQNKVSGKKYTLSDDTKILLSDCMYGGRKANNPKSKKWLENIEELRIPLNAYGDIMFQSRGNPERIMLKVTGLDLRKVIQKLYGDDMVIKTTTDGSSDTNTHAKAMYEARYIKGLPNGTFVINIEQFDIGAVEQFVQQENPKIQYASGIYFY